MKRQAGVWIGLGLGAVLSLAGLLASAYVPAFVWSRNDFNDPVTISPAQAYRFILTAIAPFGGLPGDAVLNTSGSATMMQLPGQAHRMSYVFVWRPRTNALRFSDVNDVAMAQVVSVPDVTCQRKDCSRYTVVYRTELQSFMRSWHPALWRAWLQQRIRSSASFVPAPTDVKTSCPGGVDVAALRRVIGSARHYLVSGGMMYPLVQPQRQIAIGGTTIAHFSMVNIAQAHGDSAQASAAIASDAPPKSGRFRIVWLFVANPWPWKRAQRTHVWLQFASDDLERTCKGELPPPRLTPIALSNQVLAPDDLAADALYRSTEEARRRTRNEPHLRDATLLSVSKTSFGTLVRTRHDDGAQTWDGTFAYDQSGALVRIEYKRLRSSL